MSAAAESTIVYPAPTETGEVAGVRIVDISARTFIGLEIEHCTYEGTREALIRAGLVPAPAFIDAEPSGTLACYLEHARDRVRERATLSRHGDGRLWRITRNRVTACKGGGRYGCC